MPFLNNLAGRRILRLDPSSNSKPPPGLPTKGSVPLLLFLEMTRQQRPQPQQRQIRPCRAISCWHSLGRFQPNHHLLRRMLMLLRMLLCRRLHHHYKNQQTQAHKRRKPHQLWSQTTTTTTTATTTTATRRTLLQQLLLQEKILPIWTFACPRRVNRRRKTKHPVKKTRNNRQ